MRSHKKYLRKPIRPFDVKNPLTVSAALERMAETSFQGRSLGTALEIWKHMLRSHSTIFLGLAGAMVPAGMKNVVGFLIKNRFIDCLVSTGANLFHDIAEALGTRHFKGSALVDDTELQSLMIDRIYDTFAREDDFRAADEWIAGFSKSLSHHRPYSTREFLHRLGGRLSDMGKKDGIVVSAFKAGVPVYCPAIGDSSIGIALAAARYRDGKNIQFDVIKDVIETTIIASQASSTGVVYIGGGTPKNFIQQTEVTASVVGKKVEGHRYAIQITQDSPQWGGLSGCTFEEAQSWGKISKRARMVTVNADATIAVPLLVSALAADLSLAKNRKKPRIEISGEELRILASGEKKGNSR